MIKFGEVNSSHEYALRWWRSRRQERLSGAVHACMPSTMTMPTKSERQKSYLTCEGDRKLGAIPSRDVEALIAQCRLTGKRAEPKTFDILAPTSIEVRLASVITWRRWDVGYTGRGVIDGEVVCGRRVLVGLLRHGCRQTGTGQGQRRGRGQTRSAKSRVVPAMVDIKAYGVEC